MAELDRAREIARELGLRICENCPAPHVENCPDCFGFGLADGAPINATRAFHDPPAWWTECATCGGKPPAAQEAAKGV